MAEYLWIDDKLFERPWFYRLPPDLKLAYLYIYRNSRPAGVWEIFTDKLVRDLGLERSPSVVELVKACNGDGLVQTDSEKVLEVLPGGKHLWIIGYCQFQYPPSRENPRGLNPENRAHRGVLRELQKWKLMERVVAMYNKHLEGDTQHHLLVMPPSMLDDFEKFWAAYPKECPRRNRKTAIESWHKHVGAQAHELTPVILDALEWQSRQTGWRKDEGNFIPAPAVWLNQHRWKDERPASYNHDHEIEKHKKGF